MLTLYLLLVIWGPHCEEGNNELYFLNLTPWASDYTQARVQTSPPTTFSSSLCVDVPKTCQGLACLQTFLLGDPSVHGLSLTSFRSVLQCHLIIEAFPNYRLPLPLPCFVIHLNTEPHIFPYLFIFPLPTPWLQLKDSWDCFTAAPLSAFRTCLISRMQEINTY